MFDSSHSLLLRLALGVFASISMQTAAYSDSCSEPWVCHLTTAYDELQLARHGIRDFCTIEVTLTSSRSVDDPFDTARLQSGTALTLSGTVSRIWPGAYRDNEADVCPLPISPGPAKFLAGGVIVFVGDEIVDPAGMFADYTGRHWLLRVLTEEQVAPTHEEPEGSDCTRGLSVCCRCEVDSAVPRPGVLWVIGATEFAADIDEAAVRDSLTLGSCEGDTDCSDSCFCTDAATAAGSRGPLLSVLALLMMLRWRRACRDLVTRLSHEFRS